MSRVRAWLQRHPPPLGWWLLGPALLVMLAAIAAVSWTTYRSAQRSLQQFERQLAAEIGRGLEEQLRSRAAEVAQSLQATRDALRRGLLRVDQAEPILQYCANQLRHREALSYMALSLADGSLLGAIRKAEDGDLRAIRAGAPPQGRLSLHHLSVLDDLPVALDVEGPPFDSRERESYRRAASSLRTGWAPVTPYQAFGSLGLGMYTPLMAADGSGLQGVVTVGVTVARISRDLAEHLDSAQGLAYIAEPDGRLIATSLPELIAQANNNEAAQRRGFAQMQDARLRALERWFSNAAAPSQQLIRIDGVSYALDQRRILLPGGLELVLGVLIEERELLGSLLDQARQVGLWVAGIALLGGLLLLLVLRRVQQRVEAISEAAQRLADGDRSARAPENLAVKELHTLATSFNRMSCQVEAVLSGLEAEVASRTEALASANAELERLVALDGLTQIANRRHFDAQLALAWRRCQREQRPLALLLVDVDDFKAYNDHYGHPAGDEVLRQVARVLAAQQRRPDDLAARYGGEEFVLLLPGADAAAAQQAGEQLLQALRALALPHEKARAAAIVTASVGAAVAVPDRPGGAEALIAAADVALYAAKAGGRNRVSLAPISHDEKS